MRGARHPRRPAFLPRSRAPSAATRSARRQRSCWLAAEIRLVTLAGPGGVGKTRLATEVVAVSGGRWRDGWRFVSLASLQAAEQVETTLADAFELVIAEGERPREVLARWLAPRELLLVIDNFEHLLTAAPLITELLGAAPGVTVLSTSREPLGLRGEHVVRIAGLSDEHGAELFLERARDHNPDLAPDDAEREAIVALCRRLDGLPLAIELTASWTSVLPIAQLASQLEHPLALLDRGARDAPARQRTLRATIDWSYNLLDADARIRLRGPRGVPWRLHRRCRPDPSPGPSVHVLAELQAKSLIARRGDRFAMLETLREYAAERLAEHADADRDSNAPRRALRRARRGQRSRARRAGLGPLATPPGRRNRQPPRGVCLAGGRNGACNPRWRSPARCSHSGDQAHTTARSAVGSPRHSPSQTTPRRPSPAPAHCWHPREVPCWPPPRFALLDPEQAERDANAALELYRQLGDQAGIAESLVSLGYRQVCLGRYRQATALAQQALAAARTSGDAARHRFGAVAAGNRWGELRRGPRARPRGGRALPRQRRDTPHLPAITHRRLRRHRGRALQRGAAPARRGAARRASGRR